MEDKMSQEDVYQVLKQAKRPLCTVEIHERVKRITGKDITRSSITCNIKKICNHPDV